MGTPINMLQFNIRDEAGRFVCQACGFAGWFKHETYGERRWLAGRGICCCCLWEPGYDDQLAFTVEDVLICLRRYRAKWIADGFPWQSHYVPKPRDWNPGEQLRRLGELAPWIV